MFIHHVKWYVLTLSKGHSHIIVYKTESHQQHLQVCMQMIMSIMAYIKGDSLCGTKLEWFICYRARGINVY